VTHDFRAAHHLPNNRPDEAGHANPGDLPRQRRGVTPQLHGRYPDWDVLAETDHWDELTRRVVLDRVENVPPFRFFDERERATLKAFCDTVTAQDCEPRIPVLAYVDEKLARGERDGWQYFDLPDDDELWRRVARGLDEVARARGPESFAELADDARITICHHFSQGDLHGGTWSTINVARAWQVVMRDVLAAFYSHPWSWNEIGFGGPAYPRGYAAFGIPHLGETEQWESPEAFTRDPVPDVKERGLD
jgi:Gluconate 2-dehydrogenase subunit 3